MLLRGEKKSIDMTHPNLTNLATWGVGSEHSRVPFQKLTNELGTNTPTPFFPYIYYLHITSY